jgi:hypothetical protein
VNHFRQFLNVVAATFIVLLAVGCSNPGGSNPNPPAPISVTLSSQRVSTMQVGTSTAISATVSNDVLNGGVTWSISCSTSTCGAFNPTKTTSGANTIYAAPSAVPGTGVVTITATSASDPTKSATASITITTTPVISVTLSTPPPASMTTGTTASIIASVTGDSANAGVTWSVTCGSSQCGSFNPTNSASGTATTYTAPSTAPSGNTVTIQATSVTDTTNSATANITVTTPAPSALADGTYVYNISGQDNNGVYFVVGAFAVKSDVITGGEQDFVDPGFAYINNLDPANSNITLTNGAAVINLAVANNNNVGANGIETFHGTMVSGSRLLITQFDNFASAAGSIDLQTNAAAPSGGYAFMVNGADDGTPISQLAIGGILNVNGGALATSGSVFDYNDSGTVYQAQSFASGSISAPDNYGRVTINLVPSTSSNIKGFVLTGYIIGNRIQLIEDQNDALNGVLGGVALSQGANTGKFTGQSVVGASYAYGLLGMDGNLNGSGLVNIGGGFGFNSNGTVGGAMAYNDLDIHNGNSITGNYTVDPTGRVTISNVIPSNISNVQFTFQLYLDGNGNALVIGADDMEATGGLSFVQTNSGSDYEGNYALSAQGILNEDGAPGWAAVGPINISSDNITGSTDYTAQGYNLAPGLPLTGTENSSTGLFTITGLSPDGTVGYGYYPIDDTHVLAVSVSNLQIGLMMLEGITVTK